MAANINLNNGLIEWDGRNWVFKANILNGSQSGSIRKHVVSDFTKDSFFVMTEGDQTINGKKTFTGAITLGSSGLNAKNLVNGGLSINTSGWSPTNTNKASGSLTFGIATGDGGTGSPQHYCNQAAGANKNVCIAAFNASGDRILDLNASIPTTTAFRFLYVTSA
jgi:hypothetical protein